MANRQKRIKIAEQQIKLEQTFRQAIWKSRQFKRMTKKPLRYLRAIKNKDIKLHQIPNQSSYYLIATLLEKKKFRRDQDSFYDFLVRIAQKGGGDLLANLKAIQVLSVAYLKRHYIIRPISTWKASKKRNYNEVLSSLLRHIFVEYQMPKFMDQVWYLDDEAGIKWYLHIAFGQNIRTACSLPIAITKKTAHEFLKVPTRVNIRSAIRWAQVIALGGNSKLAQAVIATPIGHNYENNAFWQSVIRFFIANPTMNIAYVRPIVNFIQTKKFGKQNQQASQPHFSMKGRTLDSIMAAMNQWYHELAQNQLVTVQIQAEDLHRHVIDSKSQQNCWEQFSKKWRSFGIGIFKCVEEVEALKRTYTIRHLKTALALHKEGRTMNHCVGSYVNECEAGESAIFSLTVIDPEEGLQHLATIEVDDDREIIQISAKHNATPSDKVMAIIQIWAKQNFLTII